MNEHLPPGRPRDVSMTRRLPAARRGGGARLAPLPALLLLLIVLILGAAGGFGIWYVWSSGPALPPLPAPRAVRAPAPPEPLPTTPAPVVEPVDYVAVTRDEARRINALVPFVRGAIPPAPPFRFTVTPEEREKATTCLASAAYYEAGDDAIGQAAVIQVVLNRAQHPAFPASVCGVVFQGSERRTGCQFTFTCDGALARRPRPEAWARARTAADAALAGFVFRPVGTATHYHTDWVVPNWGPELDKIAEVHTHLFFRFKRGWGSPAVFRKPYAGPEPIDPRIAALSRPVAASAASSTVVDATAPPVPGATAGAVPTPSVGAADLGQNVVRLADPSLNLFVLQLDPAAYPGSYAVLAWKLCRDRVPCRVAGWLSGSDVPQRLPLPGDWRRKLGFLYEKSGTSGQTTQWDCATIARDNQSQCLPGTNARVPGTP